MAAPSSDVALVVAASVDEVLGSPGTEPTALLTPDERRRAADFRRDEERRAYVAAHVLVRLCAAAAIGAPVDTMTIVQRCDACGGPHGRPVLSGHEGWHASLSRATGVVAAAVAPAPVGVDIERVEGRKLDPAFLALVLHPREAAAVEASSDPISTFLRLWVRKESLVKLGRVTLDGLRDIDATDGVGELHLLDWVHPLPVAVTAAVSKVPLRQVQLEGVLSP